MVLSRNRAAVHARRRRRLEALLRTERALWERGFERVAGVDEAGVVEHRRSGLNDRSHTLPWQETVIEFPTLYTLSLMPDCALV